MSNKHTAHKYTRIKLGKNYIVYKCALPGCTHHIRKELVVGRMSICWRCGVEFEMTRKSLLKKPHCPKCLAPSQSKALDASLKRTCEFITNHGGRDLSVEEYEALLVKPSDASPKVKTTRRRSLPYAGARDIQTRTTRLDWSRARERARFAS